MPGLDDLPHFSPWPARLLGLTPSRQFQKLPAEVQREYEGEKWGPLLRRVRAHGGALRLADVEEWQCDRQKPALGWVRGDWQESTSWDLRQQYLGWVHEQLKPWLPAGEVVELGAGYGSVLLGLAVRGAFGSSHLSAGEYTASGVELIGALAEAEGLSVQAGSCDFRRRPVCDWEVPPGALVYTSYAACYLSPMSEDDVRGLIALRPGVVVHLEPLYEHGDEQSMLGLLRRRYMEVNDYSRNLLTALRDAERKGLVEILVEQEPGFGANPLLAASVVAWRPR